MLQEAGHIKNVVLLIFQRIQHLHLMYSEVVCVLVSSVTHVQRQNNTWSRLPSRLSLRLFWLCTHQQLQRKELPEPVQTFYEKK